LDEVAAHAYGDLRATLEQAGQPLAEPDLRHVDVFTLDAPSRVRGGAGVRSVEVKPALKPCTHLNV